MLKAKVPNIEMHIYGNGVHGNGLKDAARDVAERAHTSRPG
jgi:hypothetical protein